MKSCSYKDVETDLIRPEEVSKVLAEKAENELHSQIHSAVINELGQYGIEVLEVEDRVEKKSTLETGVTYTGDQLDEMGYEIDPEGISYHSVKITKYVEGQVESYDATDAGNDNYQIDFAYPLMIASLKTGSLEVGKTYTDAQLDEMGYEIDPEGSKKSVLLVSTKTGEFPVSVTYKVEGDEVKVSSIDYPELKKSCVKKYAITIGEHRFVVEAADKTYAMNSTIDRLFEESPMIEFNRRTYNERSRQLLIEDLENSGAVQLLAAEEKEGSDQKFKCNSCGHLFYS